MEEKTTADAAAAIAAAAAADQDGAVYCSEHPYPPGATAAAGAGAGGICAFCLQEKLGMLVSSSKSSPFHPPPPPVSASPSSPPSTVSQPPPPPPLLPSQKAMPPSQKTKNPSSSAAVPPAGVGLKRSKSVAPRPEEGPLAPAPAITADSPRKKSFWSFLHLSSSSSSSSHKSSAASSTTAATNNSSGGGAARRNSLSVASASLGGRLEAIAEPAESPGRRSEGSSSSSFGRKVARSRSVGCGSRSFSGDFLERLSNGFGDCALRRVESHREPKPNNKLCGVAAHDEDEHAKQQHHRIKCAGFFGGGMGAAAPPPSSSYWLSAPDGGGGSVGSSGGTRGSRSHRSWAWALASPMRALRPASSASSKTIMAAPHGRNNGNMAAVATS
ncbi:hypothetical protein PR202_ga20452 [Eleusine coracana subsp. coracana]|uniref:Uncharacterized protein n=1 Tax=Eleusine coracana subsp. coracana TaxID=191504 RepID=A0AAV5CY84_ELECO|nr:hypothetical protein QOZ80_4AG0318830 [Eleusine coracana subsp. coracana]GJN03049.1 hypothetical protein PR202_ga20452 [Eleusine coracana subsp. coracana]